MKLLTYLLPLLILSSSQQNQQVEAQLQQYATQYCASYFFLNKGFVKGECSFYCSDKPLTNQAAISRNAQRAPNDDYVGCSSGGRKGYCEAGECITKTGTLILSEDRCTPCGKTFWSNGPCCGSGVKGHKNECYCFQGLACVIDNDCKRKNPDTPFCRKDKCVK